MGRRFFLEPAGRTPFRCTVDDLEALGKSIHDGEQEMVECADGVQRPMFETGYHHARMVFSNQTSTGSEIPVVVWVQKGPGYRARKARRGDFRVRGNGRPTARTFRRAGVLSGRRVLLPHRERT